MARINWKPEHGDPWKVISRYYEKRESGELCEEDIRLFIEACEYEITLGMPFRRYDANTMASLFNLAAFYRDAGSQRLADKYFTLYKEAHDPGR